MNPDMRVSVLRGIGDIAVDVRVVPVPAADEVLVRVRSVGVCGSDTHYYDHGRIGRHVVEDPVLLGHEAGGVAEQVGSGVTSLRSGDRVSIEPGVPCRSCAQCLAGRYNLCPQMRFFATPPIDGAFAEYVAVPELFAHKIPDSMSDDDAALIEPLSVGVWACRRTAVGPGDRVLVTGAGPIGLLAGQVALTHGATDVAISDLSPRRLALAAELGMRPLDLSAAALDEYDVCPDVLIECSGHGQATWDALHTVAPAGRVVLVGMGGDVLELPLSYVQDNELTILGAFRYANTWPTAIDLVAAGRIQLQPLVTGHFDLDHVEDALTAARTDPDAIKSIVNP